MARKRSLYEEMKAFQREKKKYVIFLILFGLLGLIFPIIPGLFLIGLGIALISPRQGQALFDKIKDWFQSLLHF